MSRAKQRPVTRTPRRARAPLRVVPAIHRATHQVGLLLAAGRDDGLSQGEAHILAHLASSGAATIADLHRGLAHKRSTLTSILDRLAARGLVTREPGVLDRRTFVITPTAGGMQVARGVHDRLAELERAVRARVSDREVSAFTKVVSAVEDEARQFVRRQGANRENT